MANHYFIYLGRENGKRTIHKVGQTTRTCYARCKSSDYKIGCAFDIQFNKLVDDVCKKALLNTIEQVIINDFKKKYHRAHGREYFRTPKKSWEDVKKEFIECVNQEAQSWIRSNAITEIVYYEGWVTSNTY